MSLYSKLALGVQELYDVSQIGTGGSLDPPTTRVSTERPRHNGINTETNCVPIMSDLPVIIGSPWMQNGPAKKLLQVAYGQLQF